MQVISLPQLTVGSIYVFERASPFLQWRADAIDRVFVLSIDDVVWGFSLG